MKRLIISLSIILALTAFSSRCLPAEKEIYIRVGAGAGQPLLNALSGELERQGREMPVPEYVFAVSAGKVFKDGLFNAEVTFAYSLIPDIRYSNQYEDFLETMSHYDFSLMFRRGLLKSPGRFSPSLGVGFGYGRTNLVEGGGRLESFEILGSALVEYSVGDYWSLFAEAAYTGSLEEDRFSSAYLNSNIDDTLYDSDGYPLNERYSVIEFRVGVVFWLKPPKGYY